MEGQVALSDGSSASLVRGEMKLEEDEEDFRSCCEDEEVWKEIEDIVKEEPKEDLDEFSVKMFFKGMSVAEDGGSASGFSGIGVVMERTEYVPVIQVQKKLDFYVDESVADYLALMDGLAEAMQNNIRRVYAFTDSELLYDQVLELGIIVHSVVIGLSLGASSNTCTIKGLVAALCFHQMFEGMGLGGCILQAEYKPFKKAVMAFFFAVTTPFGIAIGIALSKMYKENSPNALITVGLLNASSAGLLIYMALVDLLAADFMGPKLQGSIKLQVKSYMTVLLGAGGMSLMAKWA